VGVVYLTLDQVLRFHDKALEIGGGLQGLRSYDSIAGAVGQPQMTFGGDDLYPTMAEKAAAYGFFIAESQAFLEGNKRTAAISMLAFLDLNGYDFHQSDAEIEQMFVDLGADVIGQGEFFGWVVNHTMKQPDGSA
jgi:death-on-curing protein